jgi:hypothetical protein
MIVYAKLTFQHYVINTAYPRVLMRCEGLFAADVMDDDAPEAMTALRESAVFRNHRT